MQLEQQIEAIHQDQSLDNKQRKQKLRELGTIGKNDTDRASSWWGADHLRIAFAAGDPATDLGLVRLDPFDPAWVTTYPVFKDPSKDFEPGASLCRLGFPFHHIQPKWNNEAEAFELPPGAVPPPLFPIDGILTRMIELVPEGASAPPYPVRFIETSCPGLKGQSGGPIFDVHGTIWGIQSRTQHFPLGFDPVAPNTGKREHQFLNVGWGVHPDSIFGFLQQHGVKFQISIY
jgi:hypothetical protein